jgi:hypothetical protein
MDALPDGPAVGRMTPNLLELPLHPGSAVRGQRYLLDSGFGRAASDGKSWNDKSSLPSVR